MSTYCSFFPIWPTAQIYLHLKRKKFFQPRWRSFRNIDEHWWTVYDDITDRAYSQWSKAVQKLLSPIFHDKPISRIHIKMFSNFQINMTLNLFVWLPWQSKILQVIFNKYVIEKKQEENSEFLLYNFLEELCMWC